MHNKATYRQKIINDKKPQWFRESSKTERKRLTREMLDGHKKAWGEKPEPLPNNTLLVCINPTSTMTKDKSYKVRNWFASLVTTLYGSEWHQHVTITNDSGTPIKVNINKFAKPL